MGDQAGTSPPSTLEITDFNILTMNGKCFPSTGPLVCKTGDKVRIPLGNLGAMDHHDSYPRLSLPDHRDRWRGHPPLGAVAGDDRVGRRRPDAHHRIHRRCPGDWAFHCHMTHHVMNQMGHDFPNMDGVKPDGLDEQVQSLVPGYMTMGHTGMHMGRMAEMMPMPPNSIPMKGAVGPFGDYISMGGMFTIIKVRDRLESYDKDPGWYQRPRGTVALKASAGDLARTASTSMPRQLEPSTAGRRLWHCGLARREIVRKYRRLGMPIIGSQ